ncbi:MAG: rhodanese-like domain-containing protein [Verrucomicrobiae bacterium]|nr:rhodanese-like domain-containing protein [Verrucomicrobiae bacterium]
MTKVSNKFIWLALGLGVIAFALRSRAELSEAQARAYVAQGVKVVDVRTAQEFANSSITNVINIPLDEVKTTFVARFTNKSEMILLHCRTGRRSGIAENELRELGYTNVFNIGSFERAQSIISADERK